MFNRSRRITAALAVASAAAAALAIGPAAANAATSMSPATGGQKSTFTLKTDAAPLKQAEANGGFADLKLTAPRGASSNCSVHNIPSYGKHGSKLVYRLSPDTLYSHKWCKGIWKVAVVIDVNGDGSEIRTVGRTQFKVR
jgi:hypothetical protein